MSMVIPTYIVTGPSNITASSNKTEYYQGEIFGEMSVFGKSIHLDESEEYYEVKEQLIFEHAGLFIIGTLVFGIVCFLFENQPKFPPSLARARVLNVNHTVNIHPKETAKSYLRLLTDKNFVLLCLGYGLLVGVYYALSGNICLEGNYKQCG